MAYAETVIVSKSLESLQLEVIAEMGFRTSNPVVSSIAFQSLAALQTKDTLKGLLKARVWYGVHLRVLNCLGIPTTTERAHIRLSGPVSVIERYSRALLCQPTWLDNVDWVLLQEIVSLYSDDIHVAALNAFLTNHGHNRGRSAVKALVQGILDRPPLNSLQIHPWVHAQFTDVVRLSAQMDLYHHGERNEMILRLMKGISLDKIPSFQEELMIIYLHHSKHTNGAKGKRQDIQIGLPTSFELPMPVS
jgi:hypothetical protein